MAISMAVETLGLQNWPSQSEKVKQLYSQIVVRHGVMLVGPSGGGKTTARNVLHRALVLLPLLRDSEDHIDAEETQSSSSPPVQLVSYSNAICL